MFRNVIDNALSFSPPGSRIVVELSREPRSGPFVVTIDDEGPGIPEDNLESIFERFYSERPTEHFGQHSGLGLSICRQIVETYGGSIAATNRRAPDGKDAGRALHHPRARRQRAANDDARACDLRRAFGPMRHVVAAGPGARCCCAGPRAPASPISRCA